MRKDIIENVITNIKNYGYTIIEKILIDIGDKQNFYKDFYDNFLTFEKDILDCNSNQCLAIITNVLPKKDQTILKNRIRRQYKKEFPPIGNILHSSDSHEDCNKELKLLFNKGIANLKNIATYYTQLDM